MATEERLTSWARSWCRGGCGSRSTPACVSHCCCCPHPSSASGPRSALLSALGGEISSYSFKTKHTDVYRSSFLLETMRHAIKEKKVMILNLVYKPLQSIFNVFKHLMVPEIAKNRGVFSVVVLGYVYLLSWTLRGPFPEKFWKYIILWAILEHPKH